ncbi:MAG: hypothetical protein J6S89_03550 [Paludibacteraceae bacterium]|nr:hypothetical protein [Paludibacteraceae bacterium]
MKNKALRIVIWIVFILCCTLIGECFSSTPYIWGEVSPMLYSLFALPAFIYFSPFLLERDGIGILLWVFTVIPFMILLFSVLMYAIFRNEEKHSVKPYVAVFVGSAAVFFLNFLFPCICISVKYDYFSEIETPTWMWIGYVCLPFIYGGISFILFKLIGTPKDGNKLK